MLTFKVFQMEDVRFPEVIYAYQGPEVGEFRKMKLTYMNAQTTQLNQTNVFFFLQNSLCGTISNSYSQDEVILKYSWYHCWYHPEKGFINSILALSYSCLIDLFTLR